MNLQSIKPSPNFVYESTSVILMFQNYITWLFLELETMLNIYPAWLDQEALYNGVHICDLFRKTNCLI